MENKWEMLSSSNEEREKIWTKNRTFAGDVWFRFRRKPTAIAGLAMIILLLLFALAGPMFTEYSYSVQDLEVVNIPPVMEVYDTPDGDGYFYITQSLKVLYVNPDKTLGDQLKKVREESDMSMTIFDYKGEEVGLYYGQKPYVMADPETKVIYPSETVRNASYLFGTDSLGRDILTRLMYGVRVSLLVAFVAAAVNMVIGILYGGISGYLGGNVDVVMMRVVDIFYCIPTLPLMLIISFMLDSIGIEDRAKLFVMMALLTLLGWAGTARLVRGQILYLREQEYMLAAEANGLPVWRKIFNHLLPNVIPQLIVTMTLGLGSIILTEATLGYLGLGLPAKYATWGNMINVVSGQNGLEYLKDYPNLWVPPGICIILAVLAFNFIGDGLRDAFDPKSKR